MGAKGWVALVLLVVAVAGGLGYALYLLHQDNHLLWYCTAYGVFILVVAGIWYRTRRSHYVHVHHYTVAMLLVPLFGKSRFPSPHAS
jgi:hypothetical protein